MRSKIILGFLFILSLGLVGVLVVRAMPNNGSATQVVAAAEAAPPAPVVEAPPPPPPAPPPEARMILAAAGPLKGGMLLRAQDVTWRVAPGEAQPGEIVRPSLDWRKSKPEADDEARAEVYGAAVRGGLAEGDFVLRNSIVKPGDRGFLDAVLQPGSRAVTVPVATASTGAGLAFPGDRVDLLLTQNFKNDDAPLTRRSVSETVAENLRVLAIDKPDPKTVGGGPATRTVTLEVQPQEAEKINVAAELGKLSLTFRTAGTGEGGGAGKPTWAGDVSPALRSALPPPKVIQAEKTVVKVLRGNRAEDVRPD